LDQLFAQSPAPASATPTPSVAPCSSVHQSQSQLVPEKHQLSPIMEKKVINVSSSGENSTEELNSSSTVEENEKEAADNQATEGADEKEKEQTKEKEVETAEEKPESEE